MSSWKTEHEDKRNASAHADTQLITWCILRASVWTCLYLQCHPHPVFSWAIDCEARHVRAPRRGFPEDNLPAGFSSPPSDWPPICVMEAVTSGWLWQGAIPASVNERAGARVSNLPPIRKSQHLAAYQAGIRGFLWQKPQADAFIKTGLIVLCHCLMNGNGSCNERFRSLTTRVVFFFAEVWYRTWRHFE